MIRLRFILIFILAWFVTLAQAEVIPRLGPAEVVQAAISDVLVDMRSHESRYQQDPASIYTLVEQKVVPYFDFTRMTQLAMATYWRSATEQERVAVKEAFQQLFVATYSKQFFAYRNTEAEIETLPGSTDTRSTLKLKALDQRGNRVALFLRLEKKSADWKIIDVNVEGVSYVVTSRGQFSEAIANKGIEGLIQYLLLAIEKQKQ